jgi:hypothetical protein
MTCIEQIYFLLFSYVDSSGRAKEWVYGRSLAGIAGSNPAGGYRYLSLVNVVCWQVQASAMGRSPVRRSLTKSMSVISKPQKMRRPRLIRGIEQ